MTRKTFDDGLEVIYFAALERDDHEARAAYLDEACGLDTERRRQVERLLEARADRGSFLERPALETTAAFEGRPAEAPGAVIGPYKLLEPIGEGGMGTVWMAQQTEPLRRTVAMKLIKAGMDSRQVIARFEAERQALALMDHPNIAKVLDAGTTESGRPYFVLELVRGIPITDYCDREKLTIRERLGLFGDVCQAVQHAHQKGVIHRDLKPSNVLVTVVDGAAVPKVIDFGVAKAIGQKLTERTLFTAFAQLIGTPLYMSPEQAALSGVDVDTRSDIYSLGVLLYELLTGTTPFDRESFHRASWDEMRRLIREEEPPRPSTRISDSNDSLPSLSAQRRMEPARLTRLVRGDLDWIVMKCLEKDRSRRYETAAGVAADLRRYLDDEPVLACPPSAVYRFRKLIRRHRSVAVSAAAVALAVVGLATSTLWIAYEQRVTASALLAETRAKEDLRRDGYFHRIALAHRELAADDLLRASELLGECPEDLRAWEWHYLKRLCREDPLILRDEAEVNSVAFSPDGRFLAAADGDGAIKVWDSRTGQLIRTIGKAHSGYASSIAYHPDGLHLASVGADDRVKIWDLTTGLPMFDRPSRPHHVFGTAYAAVFSPDGRQLAAGSDGVVTTWDWRNDRPLHSFPGHEKRPISVAFSRDGQRLATGAWRGRVRLWDAGAGGEPLSIFAESREIHHPVTALSFGPNAGRPDGARLATSSYARRVDVWDTTTGRLLRTLRHRRLVLGTVFSPDGLRLASAGEDKTVRVWDATTGREVLVLRGHTGACACVAFSPDGLRLASAGKDWTIRIWDATPLLGNEGRERLTFTQQGQEIWNQSISPDGQLVVSAGLNAPPTVWDPRTGRVVSAGFDGHRDIVFDTAWRPDGRRVASAGAEGGLFTVKVWDPQTGREDFTLPDAILGALEFFSVIYSPEPDSRYLVTGRGNGTVQVWDGRNGRPVGPPLGTHRRPVRRLVFSPDRRHLASVSDLGEVKLWDATRLEETQDARLILTVGVRGQWLNVAFSPDSQRLATGGEGSTVKVWNVQTGEELRTFPSKKNLPGHSGDVYAVAFSPDSGRWVASAGEDSTVKVWDSDTGDLLLNLRGHTGLVTSVAFSPDGRSLISGSHDYTAKIWDLSRLGEVPGRSRMKPGGR
ncbi:WD40 repeat [Singulisphaera sp. GP187]|uniref:WD40 repeat domain-containing serine/threonine protein kinase n=1 Tax=Singulisphaera sp. GP187 TaxID=1882752 RepID=UPI000929260D|nr:serine/threonine-protein kinase [Singulisphaera sp. GP187]SIO58316.1 WD40 repeat [Singulisphaera sp. GP187]